ncbi:hypothetical protein MIND_00377200 [Mycena indigotica]|uniref:Transmembrane protein n=1 Tax=Mycena indigotica TaxID=2126181 RepID=A0A8H6T469_9AGAR|nr:uncharacterized protein MIND_00377200 [Mycena indigotica]KAF7310042.1 hypothetical protein MIND_00377200 [Mycena indigotica]
MHWQHTLLVMAFAVWIQGSSAELRSRTIDDTNGDSATGVVPFYSPANQFSQNSNCSTCRVVLDPSEVHDGTWHDSSQTPNGPPVSISLSFTGVSLSIFCILANFIDNHTISQSSFAFFVDGNPSGTFLHVPDKSTTDFIYGANVFSVDGLEQSEHTVILATNSAAGSLLLFDFASYTFDDGFNMKVTNFSPSEPHTTAVLKSKPTTSVSVNTTTSASLALPLASSLSASSATMSSSEALQTSSALSSPSPTPSLPTKNDSPTPELPMTTAHVSTQKYQIVTVLISVIISFLVAGCIWLICRRYRLRQRMRRELRRVSVFRWAPASDGQANRRKSRFGEKVPPTQGPETARSELPPEYVSEV